MVHSQAFVQQEVNMCQFQHNFYKCGAKHPAIQCSVPAAQQRSGGAKPK